MHILDKDDSVIAWSKDHDIYIPYLYLGKTHYFIPDFLIEYKTYKALEEVKGYVYNKEVQKLKYEAMKKFCNDENIKMCVTRYDELNTLSKVYFGRQIQSLLKEYKKTGKINV